MKPPNNSLQDSRASTVTQSTVQDFKISEIETDTVVINYDTSKFKPLSPVQEDISAKKNHELLGTKPKCFRCNTIFQQLSGLIKEGYDIQKTGPPIECPYCNVKKGKCPKCYTAVKKFLAAKLTEYKIREKSYTTWLQKVKQLLVALSDSELTYKPARVDDSPDEELEYLLMQLQVPLAKIPTRLPCIGQFPSTDFFVSSSHSIKENQKILKDILVKLRSKKQKRIQEINDVGETLKSKEPVLKVLAEKALSDKGVAGSERGLSSQSNSTFDSSDWLGKGYTYGRSVNHEGVGSSMKRDDLVGEPTAGRKFVTPTGVSSETQIHRSGDEAVKRFFSSSTGLIKNQHYGGFKGFAVDEYSQLGSLFRVSPVRLNKQDLLSDEQALRISSQQLGEQYSVDGDREVEIQQKYVKGDFYISTEKDFIEIKEIIHEGSTEFLERSKKETEKEHKVVLDRPLFSKEKLQTQNKPDQKSRKSIIVDTTNLSRKEKAIEHVIFLNPRSQKRTKDDYIVMARATRSGNDQKADVAHKKQESEVHRPPPSKKYTMVHAKDTIVLSKKSSQLIKEKKSDEGNISILKQRGKSLRGSVNSKKISDEAMDFIPPFLVDLDFSDSNGTSDKTSKTKSSKNSTKRLQDTDDKPIIQIPEELALIRKEREQKFQSHDKPKEGVLIATTKSEKQKSKHSTKPATIKPISPKDKHLEPVSSKHTAERKNITERPQLQHFNDAVPPPTPIDSQTKLILEDATSDKPEVVQLATGITAESVSSKSKHNLLGGLIGKEQKKKIESQPEKDNKSANIEVNKINKQKAVEDASSRKLMLKLHKERKLKQKRSKQLGEIKTSFIAELPELKPKRRPKRVEDDDGVVECQQKIEIAPEIIIGQKVIAHHHKKNQRDSQPREATVFNMKYEFNSTEMLPSTAPKYISKVSNNKNILDEGKGILCYKLSNKDFVDNGVTILPEIKVMRQLNIYKMCPPKPECSWYARNKFRKIMFYDTGEKLAEIIDVHGHFRWYYRNGSLALDFFESKDLHAENRYVIYSTGKKDHNGNERPVTVLASFDQLGNGVVYDHYGNYRLKYNQSEGALMDPKLGPLSKWKWHNLNDPAVLKPEFIDNYISIEQRGSKLQKLIQSEQVAESINDPIDIAKELANEEMLAVEVDNQARDKAIKLAQKYKPYEIKTKSVKINDEFSLNIFSQSKIYLMFRDWPISFKLNLGLVLLNDEIIDTVKSGLHEVFTPYDHKIPKTESILSIRHILDSTKRHYKKRRGVAKFLPQSAP